MLQTSRMKCLMSSSSWTLIDFNTTPSLAAGVPMLWGRDHEARWTVPLDPWCDRGVGRVI